MSGKGDSPRPFSVSQDTFANNWELTFGKRSPREIEDARREDEEFNRILSKNKSQDNQEADTNERTLDRKV